MCLPSTKLAALLLIPVISLLGSTLEQKPAGDAGPRLDADGEPLPPGALFRFGSRRYLHPNGINDSAISPDGKLLATAAKTSIAIWDLSTGKAIHFIRDCGIPDGIGTAGGTLAFSPDGKKLVSASGLEQSTLIPRQGGVHAELARVWDVASGTQLFSLSAQRGWYSLVLFPSNGSEIVTSSSLEHPPKEVVVRYWDATTGKELRSRKLPGPIYAFTSDNQSIVHAADDEAVVAELASGKELARIKVPGGLGGVALSPDKRFVAHFRGREFRVWSIDGATAAVKEIVQADDLRAGRTLRVVISPDRNTVFVTTHDGSIRRWDLRTNKELAPFQAHQTWVTNLLFRESDNLLITTSRDCTIRQWELTSLTLRRESSGYVGGTHACLSPDGAWLAIGDQAGRLELRNVRNGEQIRILCKTGAMVTGLCWTPDGSRLAAGRISGTVELWEATSGRQLESIKLPAAAGDSDRTYLFALGFSPNGQALVTNSNVGLQVWSMATRKEVWREPDGQSFSKAAFSPDGSVLMTGGRDEALHFRDPATGKVRTVVAVARDLTPGTKDRIVSTHINSIAYALHGRLMVTAHIDGTLRLWENEQELARRRMKGHEHFALSAAFSPDGKWIVSGSTDQSVRVWEAATGKEVMILKGHDSAVQAVAFGPDGKTVLSNADNAPLLWSLRPPDVPTLGEPGEAWATLALDDAPKAYRLQWALMEHPQAAVDMLKARLIAAKTGPDRIQFDRLVAELDSDVFRTREAALKALREIHPLPRDWLGDAIKKAKSPEVRRRLTDLAEASRDVPTPDERRLLRAVQVLELAGTPECRTLLETWAGGAAGALLTEEAKAALGRLKER